MKQLLDRYEQLSTTTTRGKLGSMKAGHYESQKAVGTFVPSAETERHIRQVTYNTGEKTKSLLAGADCMPLCFDPLHICDRAHEARMHTFSMTISVSAYTEPKTVSYSYSPKKEKE